MHGGRRCGPNCVRFRKRNNKYKSLLEALLSTIDCFVAASKVDVLGFGDAPLAFSGNAFGVFVLLTLLMKQGLSRGKLLWVVPWVTASFLYPAFTHFPDLVILLLILFYKPDNVQVDYLAVLLYGCVLVLRVKLTLAVLRDALTDRRFRRTAQAARAAQKARAAVGAARRAARATRN